MVRRTFFSFHYSRDAWRSYIIRNCWYGRDREAAGFLDSSLREKSKERTETLIKDKIRYAMVDTDVTVVLIGRFTSDRKWVLYEISKSIQKKNGLLGIYIHNIKNRHGEIDEQGKNPFDKFYINRGGRRVYFSEFIPTYYWKRDNGYNNLRNWIETAATRMGY
ncbi:MAG: TIR domain-containing protein [Promethearchaeota archaeon]